MLSIILFYDEPIQKLNLFVICLDDVGQSFVLSFEQLYLTLKIDVNLL